jgi:hypothetical protein
VSVLSPYFIHVGRSLLLAMMLATFGAGCSVPACPSGSTDLQGQCVSLTPEAATDAGTRVDPVLGAAASDGETTSGTGADVGGMSGAGVGGGASGVNAGAPSAGTGTAGAAGAMTSGPASGAAAPATAELCRGSEGKAVCDAQGTLLVCNMDGTIASQNACKSPKLCEAGIAAQKCPECLAGQEYKCTGASLAVCAEDGMSFVPSTDCDTPGLCNALVGMCTTAICQPDAFSCQGNVLQKCNGDGTGFEMMTVACAPGMCDAMGGDCNQCLPGQKKCDGAMVMTCNAAGQAYEATACPGTQTCIGAGQCVACDDDGDCSAMTTTCKLGACVQNKCTTKNDDGADCRTSSSQPGMCSGGSCRCVPQCSNKDCGEDGCGGKCPDRCVARGQKCASGDRCVDCTTNGDCSELSTDRCNVGVCNVSAGTCRTDQPTTSCSTPNGSTGRCSNGSCVCTGSCSGRCGGDDGCGKACPENCGSNQMCNRATQRCQDLAYVPCAGSNCFQAGQLCGGGGYCGSDCTVSGTCSSVGGYRQFCDAGVLCQFAAPNCPPGLRAVGERCEL